MNKQEYKKRFIDHIKSKVNNPADPWEPNRLQEVAENEHDCWVEMFGNDADYSTPEDDADESLSYWTD